MLWDFATGNLGWTGGVVWLGREAMLLTAGKKATHHWYETEKSIPKFVSDDKWNLWDKALKDCCWCSSSNFGNQCSFDTSSHIPLSGGFVSSINLLNGLFGKHTGTNIC